MCRHGRSALLFPQTHTGGWYALMPRGVRDSWRTMPRHSREIRERSTKKLAKKRERGKKEKKKTPRGSTISVFVYLFIFFHFIKFFFSHSLREGEKYEMRKEIWNREIDFFIPMD